MVLGCFRFLILFLIFHIFLICRIRGSEFGRWDFYSHHVVDVLGREVDLEEFRGKVSLVVNVASECAYTHDHYKQMVQIQEELKDKDFTVLAFPCNQFGNQEPHDNIEIEEFVSTNYGLTFPLFGKINVRGHNVHSLYNHIKDKSGLEPNWNFWKFLVNRDGQVVGGWGPNKSIESLKTKILNVINNVTDHVEL